MPANDAAHTNNPFALSTEHVDWESVMGAFLAEKLARSGSTRTPEAYGRILLRFFGQLAKTPPEVTVAEVFAFAHAVGPSGRTPSGSTINLRLAALSSFYGFLVRLDLAFRNPCDRVQRPHVEPGPARGLTPAELKRLQRAIPATPAGTRDRAIVLMLVLTGRRRSEVLNLQRCDIDAGGEVALYSYRGKGGKRGRRELPAPVLVAIRAGLRAYGRRLEDLEPTERVFNVSTQGFYLNLRRYLRKAKLPETGVHVLRHSAAKLRRDVGESIEDVSRFLDHSNLAVTTTYLRRLEGEEDDGWRKVAALLA
jgi:integrase/recombinase XerD